LVGPFLGGAVAAIVFKMQEQPAVATTRRSA
jgi:hypothetical protein